VKPDPERDAVEHVRAKLARRQEQLERARGGEAEELELEIAQLEKTLGELTFARFVAGRRGG